MKKKNIIIAIMVGVFVFAALCSGFVMGYNHVIKNQYMEECANYDNMYYMVVDDHMYLYERYGGIVK